MIVPVVFGYIHIVLINVIVNFGIHHRFESSQKGGYQFWGTV